MEGLGTLVNIIQGCLWVGSFVWFIFSYKKKIDSTLEASQRIGEIENKMESMKKYICDLSDFFYNNPTNNSVPHNLKNFKRYYQSNSPVKLTEKGENLIKDSGFDKIFEKNKDLSIQTIKTKLIPYWNADDDLFFYFAEKKSISVIKEMYDNGNSLLDQVRIFIFSHGLFEEENEIITALGIYIRDAIIREANRWKRFEEIQKANKKSE